MHRGLAPHKPIGLELRAERFTPVPGAHHLIQRTSYEEAAADPYVSPERQ